jgi:hypothetical protein
MRDRIDALESIVRTLRRLERLRRARLCVLVPASTAGFVTAVFVAAGRVAATRTLPPGPGARVEIEAGLAAARTAEPSLAVEDADELQLIGTFLRRPPPELRVAPLEADAILRLAAVLPAVLAGPDRRLARARAA